MLLLASVTPDSSSRHLLKLSAIALCCNKEPRGTKILQGHHHNGLPQKSTCKNQNTRKLYKKPKPHSTSFYVIINETWYQHCDQREDFFPRLLAFSHTSIHKFLQDSTVYYEICCRKHNFRTILLLVLPKPVFCSTTTLEDQNKGNIYRNNRGIGLLLVFQ